MTKDEKDRILIAGRAALRAWLEGAEAHGTIYYTVPHVARSGMSRRITLHTILLDTAAGREGKPYLSTLWPSEGPHDTNHYPPGYQDVIAKDWGFSFQHRAFVIGGCGMDMVFALVERLARLADMEKRPAGPIQSVGGYAQSQQLKPYSNRVHRTQIGG